MRNNKFSEPFHIVLTTHNSRTWKRMIKYRVRKGHPIRLHLQEEISLTKIIRVIESLRREARRSWEVEKMKRYVRRKNLPNIL